MNDIEMHEVSDEFADCWRAAGRHLQSQTHDGQLSWLKANLNPPFLEHLSFRMGNQLFYVRIDDVDGEVQGPGNTNGFRTIANGCNGHSCRLPMRLNGAIWEPTEPSWGLIDGATGKLINPIDLVSDEKLEVTDWEVHDFAVQVVRDYITDKLGHQLMSSQGNPSVDPSIWFVGENGPEWVVVRSDRFPMKEAEHSQSERPETLPDIAANCAKLSNVGHFASVIFANSDDAFDPSGGVPALPLWRGHGDIDLMKASQYELEMGPVRYAISMADNPPKGVADAFLEGQNAQPFGRDGEDDVGGEGRYSLHAMPLTRAGNEIAALLDWQPSEDAIKRFEEALRQQGENLKAVGLGG